MNRIATFVILFLLPMLACATPMPKKEKESIVVEVASIKTNVYTTYMKNSVGLRSRYPSESYTYTDILFAVVNGKHVVYTCVENKKVCPLLEAGSKLEAEQDGDSIYISTTSPLDKKTSFTHYRLVGGSW